jgi:serine/threonine protein kinase
MLLGLLYRAPELLRITMANPGVGSQKGDVYAFGIILYELHSRRGPFGDTTGLTTQQILQKVIYPPNMSIRPFR